jgi:hypothetical protein
LIGQLDAVPCKYFRLPMERQVIRPFAHDHVRQDRIAGRALLDRLRGLGGRLHRAGAGVAEAGIFDHLHLRGQVFVALADLFADAPQILIAVRAMLLGFWKIVLDALALQMARQRLASPRPSAAFSRCTRRGLFIVVVGFIRLRLHQSRFGCE